MPKFKTSNYDKNKFKELIVYIASRCETDRYWNATKLNKVLFYSDFISYRNTGKSITGAMYFALPQGPAPKALLPVLDEMIENKDIAIERRKLQHRTIALRNADLSIFSAQEIAIVDKVIEALRHRNAEMVSEMSHAFLGWKAARAEGEKNGENVTIPYGTAYVTNPPIDEFEASYGMELFRKYGWAC